MTPVRLARLARQTRVGIAATAISRKWRVRLQAERDAGAREGVFNFARRTAPRALSVSIAVLAPGFLLWLWASAPSYRSLVTILLSLSVDNLRATMVVELAGLSLTALITALLGRPLLVWAASGAWFAFAFVARLPSSMPPRPLPFEVVDQQSLVLALVAVAGLGVAVAALGTGVGYAFRSGSRAAWRAVRAQPRRTMALAGCGLVLSVPAAYGISQAPRILTDGPWQGVVRPAAGLSRSSPPRELTFGYQSRAFGTQRQAVVILPEGYDGSPTARYPVIYLLHGCPGSETNWANAGSEQVLGAAERAGKAPPSLLVLPDGDGPRGGCNDSWADGWVPGDAMESDLVASLIPAVDARFRTIADRQHRAIGGTSTGGYGAANLALRHPQLFGLALVFSIDPVTPPSSSFGGNPGLQRANDPLLRAGRPAPREAPYFYLGWGMADVSAGNDTQLASTLRRSGYGLTAAPISGGHSWTVFRELFYNAMFSAGNRLAGGAFHTGTP